MGQIITVDVTIDASAIIDKIEDIFTDDCMLEINNAFAKFCDPYVPKDEGVLSQTLNITPEYVEYKQRYAHYQYEGEVYGPSYPIKEGGTVVGFFTNPYGKKAPIIQGGDIVGWYSPPNKHPTGRKIQYNTEKHGLATDHWDKAMMRDQGDVFTKKVEEIVNRRAKDV